MNQKLLLLMGLLPLLSGKCKKEGADCHYSVAIRNASADTVICAFKATNLEAGKCMLYGEVLPPGQSAQRSLRTCWEDELSNGGTLNCYIVDPALFNTPGVFYNCDSLPLLNKVLRQYQVNLQQLKNDNFAVVYP